MIFIGIDVGLTGAVAAINEHAELVGVHDLVTAVAGRTQWIDSGHLLTTLSDLRQGKAARVYVEQTHAMPGMGVLSVSSKGLTLGSVLATVGMAGLPLELVPPAVWKRSLGLLMPKASDRERKAASLSLARQRFPSAPLDRARDHNRAEALLIAEYARRDFYAVAA